MEQQIVIIRRYGGPGSGHHGHAGRPGAVGGSGAGGGRNKIVRAEGAIHPSFDLQSTGRTDWDSSMLNSDRFKVVITKMTPDEFLVATDYKRYQLDQEKVNKFVKSINSNSILPTPTIVYDQWHFDRMKKEGIEEVKTQFHDGMHRVLALKQLKVTKFPVIQLIEKEGS